jgi:hypothetical protein
MLWGMNFICVCGYPDHHRSFVPTIIYSLLSVVPFAAPILTVLMIWKKSAQTFKLPL